MGPAGRWAAAAAALISSASAALATENIICSSADEKAAMAFLVGTTPGLNPLSLTMDANGKSWATKPEGKQTAILIAQAFSDDEGMKIDITDDNAERIIAKLRVTRGHDEGSEPVTAGTLMIVGEGAWPVTCSGE
ncbi:hypothetical protein [Taklimakanibacter deserti]|uniref:hypothetical protein n=1 Tax=Taklimakanibacter deserti TaxID=2267839 RepID=UPI000E65CB30